MADTSTKEKLLMAALDLFSQKGYSATSVDEIAESIGITGPSIYRYFKGKAALLEELTGATDAAYMEKMQIESESVLGIRTAQQLKEFSLGQINYTLSNERIVRLRKMYTIEQFRNKTMGEVATNHQYNNILGMYIRIFSSLMDYGKIKKGDPEIVALEYMSPITLIIQLCDREPSKKDEYIAQMEKHIDFFVENFFI